MSDASHRIRRAAVLFAGGPAPAANAVISTCAASFLRMDVDVVGIRYGYSNLVKFGPDYPLTEGRDYLRLDHQTLSRTRNKAGILLGTARTNPGREINSPVDFDDPQRTKPLKAVYDALCSLEVDAMVSIGGDDTLKTANKLYRYQQGLPDGSLRIPVVHIPKTIDNDFGGIDFTFGYFTAVEILAAEIRSLLADAEATRSYFLVETMGRSAGWLAYGAAMAGEASLVMSVEDISGRFLSPDSTEQRPIMNVDEVVARIVRAIRKREEQEHKEFGVIVLAEGLAEYLPDDMLQDVPRDEHGHISVAHLDLGKRIAKLVAAEYRLQTDRSKKVNGLQLGYEGRCARPHAFDVLLGSQLGVGAFRALYEKGLNGVMISVQGQLDLHYVPFEELVDPESLVTMVRFIRPGSDFHLLARFLETDVTD